MRMRLATVTLAAMFTALPAGASPASDVPPASPAPAAVRLDAAINRAIAERAAALLAERYVFKAMGARYAAALRGHAARGDYAPITDRAALAKRMTADLQAIAPDGHLRLYPIRPAEAPPPPTTAARKTTDDPPGIPGVRAMKWIAPGIAYISFEHLDDRPEALAAVNGFLRDHAGARALVIDSRGNHGGGFDMLGLFGNHLFEKPRHLANMDMARAVVAQYGAPFPVDGRTLKRTAGPAGTVRFEHWAVPVADRTWFDVPVYYLTSHETFSAAEHLAMILKTTRRATLIGETTGGGNHFGGTEPVGGGLELFVPIGRTSDPATGRDWERVGIAPDVAVPADAALDEALRRMRVLRHGSGAPLSQESMRYVHSRQACRAR